MRRIGIFWNPRRGIELDAVDRITRIAEARGLGRPRVIPAIAERPDLGVVTEEELPRAVDLVISIGGDGTLLGATRLLAGTSVPIWAIHTGGLGFLTEALPDEIEEALPRILDGACSMRAVELLEAEVITGAGRVAMRTLAFNEVTVESAGRGRLVSLAIEVDGALVTTLDGNGVIVATPAGSTAYNLAADGPIVIDGLEVLIVNPICPHSLTNRPLIVSSRSTVTIRPLSIDGSPHLVADGQVHYDSLDNGTRVVVKGSGRSVLLIKTAERTQFDILREKLGWGDPRRPGNPGTLAAKP
jgi:NAD+ kinase